jgi:hypothetical protein
VCLPCRCRPGGSDADDRLELFIASPPERCFDLARDIDLHALDGLTQARAVGGVVTGLIGPGEIVV